MRVRRKDQCGTPYSRYRVKQESLWRREEGKARAIREILVQSTGMELKRIVSVSDASKRPMR